jgi:hypothetical protein
MTAPKVRGRRVEKTMARRSVCGVAALALLAAARASGQVPVGAEFLVNSYTLGHQNIPAVAAAAGGQTMVVWQGPDGSFTGILGRVYDSNGVPLGTEFVVNSVTTERQNFPAVSADAAGRFIVTWASYQQGKSYDVRVRRFTSLGTPLSGELQVNTYQTSIQGHSSVDVAADAAGNFVVVWDSYGQDGYGLGIFGRQFSSLGLPVGTEFQINSYTLGDQGQFGGRNGVTVARAAAGNFVVAWSSGNSSYSQDGDGFGVFAQRFSTSGAPVGTEFQVNAHTLGDQSGYGGVDAAAGGSGNFVVAWDSYYQDGEEYGVFAGRINAGGLVGAEFQVNTYTKSSQGYGSPAVAADAAGNFTIVWASVRQDGGVGSGVFGQRFLADGTRVGAEFQVNTYTTGLQWFPAIAADWQGCEQVAWLTGGPDSVATCTVDSDCPKFPGETCVGGVCERIDQQDGQDGGIFAQRYCRAPALNHFRCYTVKDLALPPFVNVPGVTLNDQFEITTATVRKVKYVCTPVDKNGEGIGDPSQHLCCHALSNIRSLRPRAKVDVADQFQPSRLDVIKGQLLCAPCLKTELP